MTGTLGFPELLVTQNSLLEPEKKNGTPIHLSDTVSLYSSLKGNSGRSRGFSAVV